MPAQDFTVDDILADGAAQGASPDRIAGALQEWRSGLLDYGRTKHEPVEFWQRASALDKDTSAALTRMRDQVGVGLINTLPLDQRKPFVDRYTEVGGDPTKMIDDQWMTKATELNALNSDERFQIERPTPLTLEADGQALATMALKSSGDDGWEALVLPLKEGGKPFTLTLPRFTPEQLTEKVGNAKSELDFLTKNREIEKAAFIASQSTGDPVFFEANSTLSQGVKEKEQEIALLQSGDERAIAVMEAQKKIKSDETLLGQIADKSLWDRFKAGAMSASVNTGRAVAMPFTDSDPFEGFEESLAQISKDTARSFLPTTREKIESAAATSMGQMAATILPAGVGTRLAGAAVTELGAASTMAPASAGQEWSSMLGMAKEARAKGDEEGAKRIESVARWSALAQAVIDTGTERIFGETTAAFKGGRAALGNLVKTPAKEAIEEGAAGIAERAVKQPAFYPEEKQQPVSEGLGVEMGAGALTGGAMALPAAALSLRGQRKQAVAAAPDAGTGQVLEEIYDQADDWAALDQEPPAPTREQASSALADLAPSSPGEATGSTAPPVSEPLLESISENATTRSTPDESPVAESAAPGDALPPATDQQVEQSAAGLQDSQPELQPVGGDVAAQRVDISNLRKIASSPRLGESALRLELKEYSPGERADIAQQLNATDDSIASLAKALKFEQQGTTRYSLGEPAPAPFSPAKATRVVGNMRNVSFVNDPNARTPQGQLWAGQADRATGKIVVNLAAIKSEEDLAATLQEEAVHLVYEDPSVKSAVELLQGAVTPQMLEDVAAQGYTLEEQPEEAAVRLIQRLTASPDGRSVLRKVVDAVKAAFRRIFRMEPNAQQLQAAARSVLSAAIEGRAPSGTGVRYATAQVFGQKTDQPTRGDSYKAAQTLAKEIYFDGDQPISEAATADAWGKALNWGPAVVGRLREQGKGSSALVGQAQVQLYRYAHQLAQVGDPSLLTHILTYAPKWSQLSGDGEQMTIGEMAAQLGTRSYPQSATMQAAVATGVSREKAETKNLPADFVDAVDTAVRETKLGEAAVRKVKRAAKDSKGKTLEEKVAELSKEDQTADQILTQIAKLQSDTPSLPREKALNAIRELVRKALVPQAQWEKAGLVGALQGLGVSPVLAERLTDVVWTQRLHNAQVTVAQAQRGLAEGTRGSLKPLEDALINAPAPQQQNPAWRKATALRYFQQLGLSAQQAAAAARLYDAEFTARLQDALEGAIEKVSKTRAPWAAKATPVRKKMLSDLDKLRRAVRLGVTNPAVEWHADLARANGWKGFTPQQFQRLSEIDALLEDESVPTYKKAELKAEMAELVERAGLPPTVGNIIVSSYTLSALSGLPTAFVQLAGPISLFRDFLSDLPTSPATASKAFIASMDAFIQSALHAARTDVFHHQVGEHLRDSEPALKALLRAGQQDWEDGKHARGLAKIIIGAQQYVGRILSAVDEGSIAAAEVYKTTLYGQRELRALGWTREDAKEAIAAAFDARHQGYQQARDAGLGMNEATVAANEIFRNRVNGHFDDAFAKGVTADSLGAIGRLSEGASNTDEGMLSKPMNHLLNSLNDAYRKGGEDALLARMAFGFISIPFRAARWFSGYSPYGLVRYILHRQAVRANKTTRWQQSYGTRVQEQQRLRDAVIGSVVMLVVAKLAGFSGDDDPEKSELKLIVTGHGPRDPALRKMWLERYQPYSITLKTGKVYERMNLGRAFDSFAWPFALAGALDDVHTAHKRRKGRRFDIAAELIGSYAGSLMQRASFQSFSKFASSAVHGGAEGIAKELGSQAVFATSSLIPWKGFMGSITRLASEPIDTSTMQGVIESNVPIIGPMLGRPALNVLGDPIGDNSLSGKLYREGVPVVVRFPVNEKNRVVYDLIMLQGKAPSVVQRSALEERFGLITDAQFYDYRKTRGGMIKEEMIKDAAKLRAMDSEQYGEALERISRRVNPRAAKAVGLKKP